jgi:ABC-type glycerol-3-phosphate transport system permease component
VAEAIVITFLVTVVVILLSALFGSMLAWALARTMLVALERRRRAFALQPSATIAERLVSLRRSP